MRGVAPANPRLMYLLQPPMYLRKMLECSDNSFCGQTVAERILAVRKSAVSLLVIEKFDDGLIDAVGCRADKFAHSGFDTFGALCILAHHERWASQGWHFFLNATGVAEGKIGLVQKPHECGIIQGVDQVNSVVTIEQGMHDRLYVGVGMNGKHNFNVFTIRGQI